MIQGKVWGTTELLFKHNGVECHRIYVKKGGTCSIHHHAVRNNAFFVEYGRLLVEIHKSECIDRTVLNSQARCEVPAGELHRFIALDDTAALEWYWVDDISKDIVRSDMGCVLPDDKLAEIVNDLKL